MVQIKARTALFVGLLGILLLSSTAFGFKSLFRQGPNNQRDSMIPSSGDPDDDSGIPFRPRNFFGAPFDDDFFSDYEDPFNDGFPGDENNSTQDDYRNYHVEGGSASSSYWVNSSGKGVATLKTRSYRYGSSEPPTFTENSETWAIGGSFEENTEENTEETGEGSKDNEEGNQTASISNQTAENTNDTLAVTSCNYPDAYQCRDSDRHESATEKCSSVGYHSCVCYNNGTCLNQIANKCSGCTDPKAVSIHVGDYCPTNCTNEGK